VSHIEKRAQAGRVTYRARYRDPSGRERKRSFNRKTDAQRFLVGVEDAKLRGADVDSATLAGIDTLSVREWVAGLADAGLSPSRIRNAHQVLTQVLTAAVEGGRLARNPAAGVRLPKRVDREMLFPDAAQVEALADAIGPHHRAVVYFLAYTGLRFGEVVALKVKRLDLLRGRCEVVESATEVGSALVWGPTKTDERRTVRLPRFLAEMLAEHLAGRLHGPDNLVFTAPMGGAAARTEVSPRPAQAGRWSGGPARDAARPRPSTHDRKPARPRGRQRQGSATLPRPQVRGDDVGPLRAPMARRARGPRRASRPGAGRRTHALYAP
jgi:integrase